MLLAQNETGIKLGMGKKRIHHNSQSGYSLYSDNSISSITPYRAGNKDLINPDFRVGLDLDYPDFKPVRRSAGCLQPCYYVPFVLASLRRSKDLINDGNVVNLASLGLEGLVSYRYNASEGRCDPTFDGSGEYATSSECVLANSTDTPNFGIASEDFGSSGIFFTFFNIFISQDLGIGGGGLSGGFYPISALETVKSDIFRVNGIEPYVKPGTTNGTITVQSGVTPSNDFRFTVRVTTGGTDNGTNFEPLRFAFVRFVNRDTDELIEVELYLSDDSTLEQSITYDGMSFPTWEISGVNARVNFFNDMGYSEIINLSAVTTRIDLTDLLANPFPSDTDDVVVRDSIISINYSGGALRNVFAKEFSSNTFDAYSIALTDPDTGLIPLAELETDIRRDGAFESYLVTDNSGKYHHYLKFAKERNPAIPYEDRQWLRIEVNEVDISSGTPLKTQWIYDNPVEIPLLDNNPLFEKTNSYIDSPISNVCASTSTFVDGRLGKIGSIKLEGLNYAIQEVSQQLDCNGNHIEVTVPGLVIPFFD